MQFSEQWLRSFVDPELSSAELAARLTMAGLEVEQTVPVAPPFDRVVVGEVTAVHRHPNADRLSVCEVDVGATAALTVVCGAPNVAAGMRVPCALEGALLPGDLRIARTTMRGVESAGMLCSARELGLSDEHDGLLVLEPDARLGADLRDVLALDDQRFTIKLTPNRGDCLSVLGVAREVAAMTGAPLSMPACPPQAPTCDDRLPVRVLAPDLCGRFSGRVIRGLDARAATPHWMRRRLERSGQRPISALVDISNYVMLELGRPSHVFDLDKVEAGLEVRWGRSGERVELLNDQTVEVDDWIGVIADARGVEALAGIMGGASTAVTLDTTNIYLEAAFWWPEAIQGRSRRFNFSTDAAHRFERGVDFATTVEHLEYLTRLVCEICGTPATRIGPVDDTVVRLPERRPIGLRVERCRKVIGIDLTADEMAEVFARLAMPVQRDAARLVVTPPSYRFDLQIEEDLIEEVARLVGFDRIPALPPVASASMRAAPEAGRRMHQLRCEVAQLGYQELINFSFVDEAWEYDLAGNSAPIRVVNPIAAQYAVMRSTLIGGLLQALMHNLNRKIGRVRLFELGRTFEADVGVAAGPLAVAGIRQPWRLGGIAYGPAIDEQWGEAKREIDFYDVKGDVEWLLGKRPARFVNGQHPALHPGRSARVELAGALVGWVGELHPKWQQRSGLPKAPVLFELDVEPLLVGQLPRVQPVPRFPPVQRDLSLWFNDDVALQQILDLVGELTASDARLKAVREFRLFDLYRPSTSDSRKVAEAGANALLIKEKSLAFRVVLQDTDRTLGEDDADAAIGVIVDGLCSRLGARLRN
jgi:phenylalanyl-tRNA synthetase beta chain